MKKTPLPLYKVIIYTSLGILGVFLVWEIISLSLHTTLFPGLEVIFPRFFYLFTQQLTYEAIGGTVLRLLISIAISLLVGFLFGVLGGVFERFRVFFRPFVTFLRTVPTAMIIFLLIVLVKPLFSPVIIVFLVTFPIMYDAVVSGFLSIDKDLIDATKVDGGKLIPAIFKVYIPLSKDYILLGLVQILGLGMKVSLMAEILTGSNSLSGIGREIYEASILGDVTHIVCYSLFAVIIIALTDLGLYFAKKRLTK